MTKSTITRERLEEIILDNSSSLEEFMAITRMALAAMDSEPVAWDYEWASCITCEGPQDFKRIIEREAPPEWAIEEGQARNIIPLYRHAQPASVVPISFDEWSRKCALQITLCYPDFREKAQYIWDSARETMQPAPVVPDFKNWPSNW